MTLIKPGRKVGILGGGQLARMLVLEGLKLGFEMHVLSESAEDPAAQVTRHWQQGSLQSTTDIERFVSQMDVTTFESEFINSDFFNKLEHCPIFPHPQTMRVLQDRLSQKRLMIENKVPTLAFVEATSAHQAAAFLAKYPKGIVLKTRRNGYDGYGTFVVKNQKELHRQFELWGSDIPPLIAEPLCNFQRELAVSFARNVDGEIRELPLVETRQVNSRCAWVQGPYRHKEFSSVSKRLRNFIEQIDYVGIMAFELFELKKEILVNEIAPRVHNSAHYSLDALALSQFQLHLLAINNLSLPKIEPLAPYFAMINLLGKSETTPELHLAAQTHLHWYGKTQNRKGRKMGHINALADKPNVALKRLLKAESKCRL